MDDGDGALSFDFEGGLDAGPTIPTASVPVVHSDAVGGGGTASNNHAAAAAAAPAGGADHAAAAGANHSGRRSFRQTVCRHWLRSLCMKGDACGFLHQYDKARMPVCRFFRLYGECREQDCVYKHTNEDIKECNMYKLGFCPNGPDCRYRHAKLPGPPPPVEEVLQRIQQMTSYNYGNSNRFFQNRNGNYPQQTEKNQFTQGPNAANQGTAAKSSTTESPSIQPQQQVQQSEQQGIQIQIQNLANGQQNQGNRTATPLPQGISRGHPSSLGSPPQVKTLRYFIVKSCNRENLELSVQQGVWATQRSNEAKLNEAFDSVENVILIFSVNRTRHFQGCAKMSSKIGGSIGGGNWKYAHGSAHYGRNFSVKWLKLCELSFHKTRYLRNPYNENLPVKISRDCQELEPSIGEQLASMLYLEPDSELMAISLAAESKREEEKAKGVVNQDNGTENPDIVPFEDNEEEEEEEEEEESEEEEEESYGPGFVAAAQGRGGRGRGMLWPPHMPIVRGARPFPGMRGFPPVMMSADGFPYGPITADNYPAPDLFGMGPRPFDPFGPRFPAGFVGPAAGMMFHSRPMGGGFGMMMGPTGRAPFMGGMGAGAAGTPRSGRPVGMSQMFQPPPSQPMQNMNHPIRRDQRGPATDKNERYRDGHETSASGTDGETLYKQGGKQQEDRGGNDLRNDESESEDEAPRRSRHGEGKKKKRGLEADAVSGSV